MTEQKIIDVLNKDGIDNTLSIESEKYKKYEKAYKYAMDMTLKELNQASEGLYHNLNSLQSRSGSQLPFSSINYGLCMEEEGRMVTRALLEAAIQGTGKNHLTPIFPCCIFIKKKGVNDKGSKNYDLYQLAIKCLSKRLYPNFSNDDWSNNIRGLKKDREIKKNVINSLTEDEKNRLMEIIKERPDIGEKINLKVV